MRMKSFRTFVLFTTLVIVQAISLYGQGSVTIFGAVTDPTGAAVAGANIVATNIATKVARQTTSGGDGSYLISQLPIGTWSVSAEAAGFKKAVQDNIQVQV